MSEHRATPERGRRPVPEVSASVRDAAATFEAEPPTPEDIAGTVGAQVVLEPDSAACGRRQGRLQHGRGEHDAPRCRLRADGA